MEKWHLSPVTNEPEDCDAEEGNCPYDGEHFDSFAKAYEANQEVLGGTYGVQKTLTPVPQTLYHVTTKKSLDTVLSEGLKHFIGPRSERFGEEGAKVFLFGSLEALEDGLGNWLGEEFDDDEEVAVVAVKVSDSKLFSPSFEGESWEWFSSSPISPSDLEVVEGSW